MTGLRDAGREIGRYFTGERAFDLRDPETLAALAAAGLAIGLAAWNWSAGRSKWQLALVGLTLAGGAAETLLVGRRIPLHEYLAERRE
ncbi:MAG: hypothetical protein ACT4PT_06525 [Methanobacteriota archaeon]